jgi:GNAT superfamily N-acetyltransferase
MTVTPLVCRDLDRATASPSPGFDIRPFSPKDDHAAVAHLSAGVGTAAGPAPRSAGLMAELRGRPGRAVACWMAWTQTSVDAVPAAVPCGVVTLVAAHDRVGAARWSIGWLLVHPDVRRRGVARALVACAVGHARAAGAKAVWTETSARWPVAAAFWRAVGFLPARQPG